MRKKLTAVFVDKVLPPTGKPQADYFDTLQPGFGLRVGKRRKTWFVMTRVLKEGEWRLQRVTLGTTAEMDLGKARAEAREAIQRAEAGQPPAEVKHERRAAQKADSRNTFAHVRGEFLAKYRTKTKPPRRPSPRFLAEMKRVLESDLFADWEERPLSAITHRDVLDVTDALVERGHETAANRYLTYLKMMFAWAIKRGILAADPTAQVEKPGAEHSRARVLTLEEIKAIWKATTPTKSGKSPTTTSGKTPATKLGKGDLFAPIVKILLLTGQRRSEVAGMRWSELDLDGALWTLPAERAKNRREHLVPLAPAVVALLQERKAEQQAMKLKDENGNLTDLVFTTTGNSPFSGWSRSKERLDQRAKVRDWTLHDARRTLVTRMNEDLAVAPHIVEAIVNHTGGVRAGVAGVYNRALYLEERRCALEAWARYVLRTVGVAGPDVVVELRQARVGAT